MCTLPVGFPPDLDYSLVSVDRVIARPFLEQVPSCRPSTATKKNYKDYAVISLYLLVLPYESVARATNVLTCVGVQTDTSISMVRYKRWCTCAVKSKETVGNSWIVLKVILGHKYHHNH